MKKLINYVLVLSFSFCYAQKKFTISQALNIASKQSMLCERLAKEKVFKVTNPNNFNTERKLGVSLIQFERNISRLKQMELPEETLFLITTTEMLWFTYKKSILNKEHTSTIKIMEYHEVLLSYCEKVFNNILSHTKKNKLYPYNSSSEVFPDAYIACNNLKHLSQKLSLYYNSYYSRVIDYDVENFNAIFSDIDAAIVNINKLKNNNPRILEKTKKIETEWQALKINIQKAHKSNFEIKEDYPKPDYILSKNNELLKDADLLIRHYKEHSDTHQLQ